MQYSLRYTILLAMIAVAFVAITTITVISLLTTRVEFSRYVDVGNELMAQRSERVVLNYLENDPTPEPDNNPPTVPIYTGGNALTDGIIGQPNLIYLNPDNFRFFAIDEGDVELSELPLDQVPRTINFFTSADGEVEVVANGRPVGIYYIEPTDVSTLTSAQTQFVESVTIGLIVAAVVASVAAIVLTLTLSRRIIQPLTQLIGAAQRMEGGDLTPRVNIASRGEIGNLARAFNSMAETLSKNEALRQTMVSDIAHELRTPLTNIRGYLEGIQDGVLDADREIIDLIYEEAIWLNRIITDLQELVLAEARQLRLVKQEVDLNEIIESSVAMYQPRARNQNIQLAFDLPYKLPYVYADPKRTGQIIRNLLSNAVKYTPSGGQVMVNAAAHLNVVEVRVTDTGNGISEEHLPYIFERFYRVDPSRSRDTGGAGLGLAIVKQLVEAQSGQIKIRSEVGKGSSFVFTIPIYRRQHAPVILDSQEMPTVVLSPSHQPE